MNCRSSSTENGWSNNVYKRSPMTALMTPAAASASATVARRIVTFVGGSFSPAVLCTAVSYAHVLTSFHRASDRLRRARGHDATERRAHDSADPRGRAAAAASDLADDASRNFRHREPDP